jgi:hypothetical protein
VRSSPEHFQIASPAAAFAFDAEGRLAALPSAHDSSILAAAAR